MNDRNTLVPELPVRRGVGGLILIAVLLYCLAGVILFAFLPDTVNYIRSENRITVNANIISVEVQSRSFTDETDDYRVTMEYVLDGVTQKYVTSYSRKPSDSTAKLQLYACPDGHYEVWELGISGVLVAAAMTVCAAGYATHLLLCAARRRKEQASFP